MKKLSFLGSSLDDLREFPAAVKSEAGYQLERVQSGIDPLDTQRIGSRYPYRTDRQIGRRGRKRGLRVQVNQVSG